jgi:tRNA pseudouridine38-40 synthase
VQEEVEIALQTVLREPLTLTVAGRTDRGVHAWGQVASYPHEAVDPLRLNGLLPEDISILAAEPAPVEFDARRDAVSRTYCYRLHTGGSRDVFTRRYATWWPRVLDRETLDACARALIGTHDFTAFTPTESDHVRFERNILATEWRMDDEMLELWITADTFMRHMVRILVGTMLDVGAGRRRLTEFIALLDGCPRAHAGPTAPAHGLALASVAYRR